MQLWFIDFEMIQIVLYQSIFLSGCQRKIFWSGSALCERRGPWRGCQCLCKAKIHTNGSCGVQECTSFFCQKMRIRDQNKFLFRFVAPFCVCLVPWEIQWESFVFLAHIQICNQIRGPAIIIHQEHCWKLVREGPEPKKVFAHVWTTWFRLCEDSGSFEGTICSNWSRQLETY